VRIIILRKDKIDKILKKNIMKMGHFIYLKKIFY